MRANETHPLTEPPATNAGAGSSTAAAPSLPALLKRQFLQCALVVGLAMVSYLVINHYVLQSVQVVGVSMDPTLKNDGYYLLNRCVYVWRDPQVAEIVVIKDPQDQSYAVKRIIAHEGDWVELKGGKVFVNGRQLNETYLPAGTPTFPMGREKELSVHCGKGEFFLLGDNRNNSADSRIYGPVPRQNILGAIIR